MFLPSLGVDMTILSVYDYLYPLTLPAALVPPMLLSPFVHSFPHQLRSPHYMSSPTRGLHIE